MEGERKQRLEGVGGGWIDGPTGLGNVGARVLVCNPFPLGWSVRTVGHPLVHFN